MNTGILAMANPGSSDERKVRAYRSSLPRNNIYFPVLEQVPRVLVHNRYSSPAQFLVAGAALAKVIDPQVRHQTLLK